jgi:hypothetical protein
VLTLVTTPYIINTTRYSRLETKGRRDDSVEHILAIRDTPDKKSERNRSTGRATSNSNISPIVRPPILKRYRSSVYSPDTTGTAETTIRLQAVARNLISEFDRVTDLKTSVITGNIHPMTDDQMTNEEEAKTEDHYEETKESENTTVEEMDEEYEDCSEDKEADNEEGRDKDMNKTYENNETNDDGDNVEAEATDNAHDKIKDHFSRRRNKKQRVKETNKEARKWSTSKVKQ